MTRKITKDILKSFLKCRYKSYLKLIGRKGAHSGIENMLKTARSQFQQKAAQKIFAGVAKTEVINQTILDHQILKQGIQWIIEGTASDIHFNLLFDGLKKVDGRSKIASFHYIPVLFYQGDKISANQRHLLSLYGLVLSEIQGRHPRAGIIIHGRQLKTTTVNPVVAKK